jgi:tRNA pseudouridine55 synthase
MVDRVRRALREKRVGHTGTLDPFATGVLVVCVGKATRLARFLAEGDKVYHATIRLGWATATDDLTGEPAGPRREVAIARGDIEAAARGLTGDIDQRAPAFSAKRQKGRRLYEMARAGDASEPPPTSRVHVRSFAVLEVRGSAVDVAVTCSPGTYIRALARDLGAALGVGGHLTALRRLSSSGFTVDDAVPGDDLCAESADKLRPLSSLLPGWPAVVLTSREAEDVRHGRPVEAGLDRLKGGVRVGNRVRLLDSADNLVGLGVSQDLDGLGRIQPEVVLA